MLASSVGLLRSARSLRLLPVTKRRLFPKGWVSESGEKECLRAVAQMQPCDLDSL
jgi:hypothetical protein